MRRKIKPQPDPAANEHTPPRRWPQVNDLLAWWLYYRTEAIPPGLISPSDYVRILQEFHDRPIKAIHDELIREFQEFAIAFYPSTYM